MVKAITGAAAAAALALLGQAAPAPELAAARVAALPVVDGKADDPAWAQVAPLAVRIDVPSELENPRKKIDLKAVHDGASICFLLVWEDKQPDADHKPWVWNQDKFEFVVDEEKIEDAAALAFALEGKFVPDMLSGVEAKWDVWEWGALRSSTGFARDKVHLFSKTRPQGVKAKLRTDRHDHTIYFALTDDEGTPNFKQHESPDEKKADRVPQFEAQKPSGSAADVQARGAWAGGRWTLELKRPMNTGHKDDTPFAPGKTVEFAVAVFDGAEKSDHLVSGKLVLRTQ